MLAHGSHGHGIMAGFTHPIFGIDHNVAILGSGILGYIVDQKKWYLASLAFILAMIVGGFLGLDQEATFFIEKVIASSVVVIGLFIALQQRLNLLLMIVILFIFGGFHGYAHGAEMSETNSAFKYIPGFTLGALLLAAIGIFTGRTAHEKSTNESLINLLSGIIMGCGIMMLLPKS